MSNKRLNLKSLKRIQTQNRCVKEIFGLQKTNLVEVERFHGGDIKKENES